jgi:hypothetical protein
MTTDIEWVPGSFTLNDEQKAEIVKAVEEFFDIFPKLRRPVYVQGQIPSRISVQGSYAVTDMRASHDHLMECQDVERSAHVAGHPQPKHTSGQHRWSRHDSR